MVSQRRPVLKGAVAGLRRCRLGFNSECKIILYFRNSPGEYQTEQRGDQNEDLVEHGGLCPLYGPVKVVLGKRQVSELEWTRPMPERFINLGLKETFTRERY